MITCMAVLIFLILLSCGVEFFYENTIQTKRGDIINLIIQLSIAVAFVLWIIVMIVDMFVDIV